MNEWGFGGEIKSWWDTVITAHPEWRLSRCSLEQTSEGSNKRADLTVFDDTDQAVLSLELRLPDHAEPNPYDMGSVEDAASKASRAGARWSATSNGDVFVLVDNSKPGTMLQKMLPALHLTRQATRDELDVPAVRKQIQAAWENLLTEVAPVLQGLTTAAPAPPDEMFVESLRALLARPVAAIRDAISRGKATDTTFRDSVIRWMVDQQGWNHTPAEFEEEIGRVASVSAYVFATRLLFFEALRRAQPTLDPVDLPSGASPVAARAAVKAVFDEARRVSGDYETVFSFDEVCEYALISKPAVAGWQRVLDYLGHFELDGMSYDVLGRLFERLIDPLERYHWGQHYTDPDVVDLMLSLAIPDGSGTIMDPAVGGGTFLVRGYVRKKVLHPTDTHQQRLTELAGCDQSAFASSIATVSLASRDLSFSDNYPQVKASSFFQRFPNTTFIDLPRHTPGAAAPTPAPVVLPPLDAVVGEFRRWKHVGR